MKYYLRMTDVIGSSKAPGHISDVMVENFKLKVPGTYESVSPKEMTFMTDDKLAIINLNQASLKGTIFDKGEFSCETTKPNGTTVIIFKIILKAVFVSSMNIMKESAEIGLVFDQMFQAFGNPYLSGRAFKAESK